MVLEARAGVNRIQQAVDADPLEGLPLDADAKQIKAAKAKRENNVLKACNESLEVIGELELECETEREALIQRRETLPSEIEDARNHAIEAFAAIEITPENGTHRLLGLNGGDPGYEAAAFARLIDRTPKVSRLLSEESQVKQQLVGLSHQQKTELPELRLKVESKIRQVQEELVK